MPGAVRQIHLVVVGSGTHSLDQLLVDKCLTRHAAGVIETQKS